MEPLTPTRRRTRSSMGSKGDVTPTPSKENRMPGSGSASKSGRRSAKSPKSPKSPKSDFSALSDDSFHTPPLQERNSLSENLSVSFSTEAESLIGVSSVPAAKRMTADPNILKELIDDIASAEQRLSSSSARKSPRATKSPAKSPGKSSSAKKKQSAKKQQERRKTVDGTALSSLLNELDDSVVSGAESSVMSALSPATGSGKKNKKTPAGNRRHTASPSILRELMEGGESVVDAPEDSNDSLSFTISPDNSPALHVSGTESEANLSLDASSVGASVAPANLKRRSLNMGRHRDSLSNFMAQLESSDEEEAPAASDEEDAQSEKRRKSNSGRTPRRETASPGVLEALVNELQNERASIEPIALADKSLGSPDPTITGTISLTDSSIDMKAHANRSVHEEEERRRTASPGMLMALMDDLQDDSQQPHAAKRRRSSAFSPSPRRSKRVLNESPSPMDSLHSLQSPKPTTTAAADDAASDAGVVNTTADSSGVFAVPTTTNKPPLRGILSSQKKPRPNDRHSVKKSVVFGSPEAAEFVADDPSMSYTPLQKQVAKSLFPMEPVEQVEEEEDEETKYNSHVLEEWERLSAASEGDGSPLADSDDEGDEMVESTPMSTTSSNRSRRRKSMLQPSAEKLRVLRGELDAESEGEQAVRSAQDEEPVQPAAASPAPQARPSFAPSSVSSLASEDRTAKLPGSLADLLREEGDKLVGRVSMASSRLSFLSDDDHTAQLPGNLADLLREEGELSVDVSGQDNTVELETDLAGLLNQAAVPVRSSFLEQQPEYEPEESTELSGLLVQRGRLSAIAEAAETSGSDSAQSASSIAHSSRVSTPGSARSARSVRSASSLQSSPARSAFSPARSSMSGYRQSISEVSAKSPISAGAAEESIVSEAEDRADGVEEVDQPAAASVSMTKSPGAPAVSQASMAMLQRLKKLNNDSRQASLNVCATPLAGVDPNASRLSISRRLSVMSTNAKNNNNKSQMAGNSRRYPSWIPPDADGDSSAEMDAGASVLADNTNIVSHGSPEAVRQVPQLTFDDALEWALEREDDDSNSADCFVQIFAGFLERALASDDSAARITAEFFSGKLLEIIPAMVEEMPVDMGAAMETARSAWEAGEQGVTVLTSACTSEAEADRLKQVFDSYHAIVMSDWDSWEYELAGMLESEIADETFKLEDQVQAFDEKLRELSAKREEARKAQASQRIREELAAVEAKIAQANAEIAGLREQLDAVESGKQQLLATKQQTLEEIMLLSTRSSTAQDETQLSLELKQQREMLKEMNSRLSVRQSMGWWRLREHTASAVRLDLLVLPNVPFKLQFKFDNTPQLNLTSLSIAPGASSCTDRWIVGLATALVEDVLKGAYGALSEQKVKGCLAERWCDPVPLLKGIDGFIIATRMLAQQLDVLVSNHACTVRIEKQPTAEHLMVLEVTKPGCTVTMRLPVKSLLSWDRTLRGVSVDCAVVDGSVEQMQKRVMESLQRLPDKQLDISMPHCPVQEMVRLVKTVMWRT